MSSHPLCNRFQILCIRLYSCLVCHRYPKSLEVFVRLSQLASVTCLSSSPPACRVHRLPQGNRPRCLPQHRGRRSYLVCEPPASKLIHRSLGHEVLNAPVFICILVVVGACRFHQRPLSCFCIRQIRLGAVTSFRSRICAPQLLRPFNNRRIWGLASATSPPSHKRPFCLQTTLYFTVSDSGRIQGCIFPLEEDPLVRCVSPASAFVAFSIVRFNGLPHVSAKKHQHVDIEEVCGQFVQSPDHSQ